MAEFDDTHAALREVMLGAAAGQIVARDLPGDLEPHTAARDSKSGTPGWFGTVTIKKSYVSYHLIPLYTDPSLADGLSPALAKRRQGKTCFNFKRVEPELFAELAVLTRRAAHG